MWLQSGDHAAVAAGVAADPRVVRHLVARLWDGEPAVRSAAVRGLGEAARHHPALALEVVRGFIWALNDESATNAGAVLAALGEMGRAVPTLVAPFLGAIVSHLDDEGLRVELIDALTAVATVAPDCVAPYRAAVAEAADGTRPGERRALAALARALEGSS
ncbi:MAG: hypothetical protein KJ061_00515 [Vicinamibacteraceae bacterium]|nr:hypothetical protein [Vicinamibacteraceae bacterium]